MFAGCSKESETISTKNDFKTLVLSRTTIDSLITSNVYYDSVKWCFGITSEEAQSLGIPEEDYFKTIENLKDVNEILIQARLNGDEIKIAEKQNKNSLIPITKGDFYGMMILSYVTPSNSVFFM